MIGAAFGLKPEDAGFGAMREEFLEIYAGMLCVESRLFPEMPELLEAIERHPLAWGVVSNKFERFARPVMAGLARRACRGDRGDTCERAKPFPIPCCTPRAVMWATTCATSVPPRCGHAGAGGRLGYSAAVLAASLGRGRRRFAGIALRGALGFQRRRAK
jgi:phosphoglycolate phosphatase